MISIHMKTKHKIERMPDASSFEEILNHSMLNPTQKRTLQLIYLENKDFGYIADELGYSISGIKKIHQKSLLKLSKLL